MGKSVATAPAGDPVESLDWDITMGLVKLARAGPTPWRDLGNWCGQELIDSKAGSFIGGGVVEHDVPIPPEIWRGIVPNATDGALKWRMKDKETRKDVHVSFLRPRFYKDQLLALIPSASREDVEAALNSQGRWLSGRKQDDQSFQQNPLC